MKKFFYLSALSLGMMCSITACSDDDTTTIDAKNLDYTAENASSWGNYMRVVAQLLVNDGRLNTTKVEVMQISLRIKML